MPLRTKERDTLEALAFLLPNILGFFLFVAFPVVLSLVLVLTNWSRSPPSKCASSAYSNPAMVARLN